MMAGVYRDDLNALRSRNEALEEELLQLRCDTQSQDEKDETLRRRVQQVGQLARRLKELEREVAVPGRVAELEKQVNRLEREKAIVERRLQEREREVEHLRLQLPASPSVRPSEIESAMKTEMKTAMKTMAISMPPAHARSNLIFDVFFGPLILIYIAGTLLLFGLYLWGVF